VESMQRCSVQMDRRRRKRWSVRRTETLCEDRDNTQMSLR
jgi:hypothetical protein